MRAKGRCRLSIRDWTPGASQQVESGIRRVQLASYVGGLRSVNGSERLFPSHEPNLGVDVAYNIPRATQSMAGQ
jgi:hypothetical protein